MDARNLRWFSKIFIGTLIRNYLLMYEQHDGKEIKSSAEVMIKLPSSKGNNRSNGSSVTSDSSPIPSQSVVSTAPNMSAAPSSSSMSMSYFSENSSKMGYQPRNMDRSTGNARNTFTRNNRNQSGKMETTSRTIPAGFDFDGMMMFFSRFIYWLNNHRFNQALISVIMEEIHKLSSGSAHRLTADDSLLGHGGSVENLDTNSFTVSIMSLKILGRTLGLLHFHHFYEAFSPQDIAESGQWLNQTIIPFTEIIQQSVSKGRLCQVIPCIIEFLSMMKPIHSNLSSTQLMQNLNVFLGYTALCKLLFVIRWHPDFNLMSDGLSTNQ